jgi:hypothetical protein
MLNFCNGSYSRFPMLLTPNMNLDVTASALNGGSGEPGAQSIDGHTHVRTGCI